MKLVKINEALMKGIRWGAIPPYTRNIGFQKVGENAYRLDLQTSYNNDLRREFVIVYLEVTKAEPPANAKFYYSHHEYEERQSKHLRWRIVRKSCQALDRELKQTIMQAVVWAWGRYSLDADGFRWKCVEEMKPPKNHFEDCDEESTRILNITSPPL